MQPSRQQWTFYPLMLSGLLWLLLAAGCLGQPVRPNLTTDTWSGHLATEQAKLAFLQRYLKLRTPVQATAFHIIYHDNSTGLAPGPSDWDMRILLKVAPEDLTKWTTDLQPAPAARIELATIKTLAAQNPSWQLTSQPQVYQKTGMVVASFQAEALLFIQAVSE